MKIGVSNFKGMIPGIHPRMIPEDHGTIALNARLDDGSMTPVADGKRVYTFDSNMASFIRRPGGAWIGFGSVVSAANGNGNQNRVYVTGNGQPKIWISQTEYVNLRLPAPSLRPSVEIRSGTVDPDTATESLYVFTYLTSLGEESAPSPASRAIRYSPGNVIEIGNLPSTNPMPERLLTAMRIYRSVTDTLGETRLYFLKQIGFVGSTTDDTDSATLAEEIPSTDYDMPPEDMQGIINLPNGMMAAFSGQELMFCEPNIHHAWPQKYRLKVDSDIVGLAAFGSSVAILTTKTPYVAQGTHPDSMAMERIEMDLPCIAARGIVDMGYSVIYPSHEGLVQIQNGGASLVSAQMFKRAFWDTLQPESFVAARHRGRYVFSYLPKRGPYDGDDPYRRLGIMDTSGAQPFYLEEDSEFHHLYHDIRSGDLFGLHRQRGIVRWDDLDQRPKRAKWRSKPIYLPTPTNFGAIRVDVDEGQNADVVCRVFAGDKLVRETRARNVVDRLPSGFLSDVWSIEIESNCPVTAIYLANLISELAVG